MRIIIFAFVIFIHNGMIPICAQVNLLEYLKSDDIKGFMQFYNKNEELAIKSLITFSLNDTINSQQIWYNETVGKNINPLERSTEGADKFYASLKLKAYFWILQIYNSKYSCLNGNLCVFIGDSNNFIFDYEILNHQQQKQILKEILTQDNKDLKIDIQYKKRLSVDLSELNRSFEIWYVNMKEKGLNYMRTQKISPINEDQYKIFNSNKF